ncbi:Beige/BEACH domain containing protein [Trichomonas vaginalis G3]|uniref:Beige/BEACH domain containing protein n=1 Tax=Trichomonas vaginalis (strain ATCC PRA-98 / G3) TaxID=412133 RepID=A2E4W6_TRIV3|nr:beige/BEACH-related family [Trichomonas vaginalis G3]EAY12305.1 Beige/BEACH domain containing protein [Trichomonas vaginalis G3]KAI5552419.1 beige/BEACH-related family [Trichomonas vaginalis G3]|eukprot:XP_001324528.1 Beige/BEACH domain containing protein [Trichomonas vaginalis G3]
MEKTSTSRVQLCIPILEATFDYDPTDIPLDISNDPLLSEIIVPNQYKATGNLTEKPLTYDIIYRRYDFRPFTWIDLLNQLSSFTPKTHIEEEVVLSFAFHQSVSIFYTFDRTHEFHGSDFLIIILSKFAKSRYSNLVASIISELFEIFFDYGVEKRLVEIFPNITDFVLELQDGAHTLINTIVSCIDRYINNNGYNFEGILPQLLTLVQMIASDKAQFFELSHFNILFNAIRPQISKLNDLGLFLLQKINMYLPRESQELFVYDILQCLPSIIEATPPFAVAQKLDINPVEFPKNLSTEMKFNDVVTFPNGINLNKNIYTKFQYPEIYKVSIYSQISVAFEIIGSIPSELDLFLPKFFKIVESKMDSDYYLEYVSYYALLLSCISENMDGYEVDIPKLILDPTYSSENIKMIFIIKLLSVRLLLKQGSESYLKIFQTYLPYLPQFTQLVHITIVEHKNVVKYIKRSPKFIPTIVNVSRLLRDLNMTKTDNSNLIEEARESLFIMLSTIFRENEIFDLFMGNSLFMSFFVSLLFEENIQFFAIELCRSSFMSSTSDFLLQQFQMIITQISINSFNSLQNLNLVFMILDMLIHSISEFDPVSILLQPIHDLVMNVCQTEITQKLMKTIIKFYTKLISSKSFDLKYINELGKTLKKLEINDQETFDLLLKLLVNDEEFSGTEIFDFKIPNTCLAIFDTFYPSKSDIIDIFMNSISKNKTNAIKLNECHFDEHILTYIIQNRDQNDQKLLDLFFLIALIVSSPSVVQLYLSLFQPDDNRFANKSSLFYLEPLKNLFNRTRKFPASYFYTGDKLRYQHNFKNGFGMTFWLKLSTLMSSDLFLIGDISITTSNGYLMIKNTKIDYIINVDEWTFISINLIDTKLSVYIEKEQYIFDFPNYSIKNGYFQIGGKGDAKLSSIYINEQIPFSKIAAIRNRGIREPIDELSNGIYINSDQNLQTRPYQHSSFCNILLRFFGVEILLPLFAQIDLKTRDGKENDLTAPYIVSLLQSAILVDSKQQNIFYNSKGANLLSHLLMSLEISHLTFTLYESLFELYENLTFVDLKRHFIENILLNFDLWIPMKSDDHKQILTLLTEKFHSNAQFFVEVLPFCKLINIMRTFYWYTWLELNQNGGTDTKRQRPADFDTFGCRHILGLFAKNMAGVSFEEKEFKQLILSIITLPDEKQQTGILNLTISIIKFKPSPIRNIQNIDQIVTLLHGQINTTSENNISKVIELIILTHKNNKFYTLSLQDHLDIVFHLISQRKYSEQLYDNLEKLLLLYPELFKIVSYFSFVGEKMTLYDNVQPMAEYVISPGWSLWSIWTAIHHENDKIIDFIAKCDPSQWMKIYATIETAAIIENVDKYNFLSIFLTKCVTFCVESNVQEKFTVELMQLVYNFLFYHTKPSPNVALYSLLYEFYYQKSDITYIDFTSTGDISENSSEVPSWSKLAPKPVENFMNFKIIPRKQIFSMRVTFEEMPFNNSYHNSPKTKKSHKQITKSDISSLIEDKIDENNENISLNEKVEYVPKGGNSLQIAKGDLINKKFVWEDSKVALISLDLIKKYPNPETINRAIIIAGFLAHTMKDEVVKWISDVKVLIEKSNYFPFLLMKLQNSSCFVEGNNSLNNLDELIPIFGDNYHKKIKQNYDKIEKLLTASFQNDSATLIDNYMVDYCESAENYRNRKTENDKLWRTFWRNASASGGPWSLEQKEIKWKRDPSLQNYNCPFKLRPNNKFDNHMKASIARDEGNMNTAVEKTKIYEEELKRKYAENKPPVLLEIIDDKDLDDRKIDTDDTQKILFSFECEYITIKKTLNCKFNIHSNFAHLISEDKKIRQINFFDIRMLLWRRRFHHKTAIEIFLINGRSYLLNFPNSTSQNIVNKIQIQGLPNAIYVQKTDMSSFFKSLGFTEMWQKRQITNFDYLMRLNIFSGRSFNDPSNYPFLPWTLTEFTQQEIDLKDKSVYRDLSLPIGCIGDERMEALQDRMADMLQFGQNPFLFSSFAICPLSLYLWLLRLEPFTTMHIDMQSGKFDHASRLFASIPDTFKLVITHMNDYRELIPEFFFQPSFLLNENNFDLGQSKGRKIGDVELPPWSHQQIYEFVKIMRQSLESDIVSEQLNKWIDLFYGLDQKPVPNCNYGILYNPNSYESIWTKDNLQDPAQRASIEAAMCHIGSMPPQLFSTKHPKRQARIPRKLLQNNLSANITSGPLSCGVLITKNDKVAIVVSDSQFVKSVTVFCGENQIDVPKKFTYNHFIQDVIYITREFLYLTKAGRVSVLNRDGTWSELDSTLLSGVSLVSSSQGYHSFVTSYGSTLAVLGPNIKYTIPFYGEKILSIDMSKEFGSIVCGTSKKNIVFINLFEESKINVVKLDFVPKFISISPSFGFVCACGGSNFIIMDINGRKINSTSKLGQVTSLSSYSDEDGFDYFIAGCEDGKVYVCDAFDGFSNSVVHRCGNRVIATAHSDTPFATICLTENGNIHYFPMV